MNPANTDASRPSIIALAAGLMFGTALLHNGGIDNSWLFASLTAALIWLACIPATDRGRLLPRDWFAWLMLLELIWLLCLPALSVLPEVSVTNSAALAALPLLFFLTRASIGQPGLRDRLENVAVTFGVAVMLLALFEFLVMRNRPSGPFLDANLLAAFCNVFLFPAWGRSLTRWQQAGFRAALRSRPAALAMLATVTLIVSTSLGGLLCFLGGLGLMTLIAGRRQLLPWKGAALLLLLAGLSYQGVYSYQLHRASPLSRIATEVETGGHATIRQAGFMTERRELVASALAIYRDGPWYGRGTGSFKALYPAYRSKNDVSTGGNLVHNDYVQFLMEGGPLLLLMPLGILAALLLALLQAGRDCGQRIARTAPLDHEPLGFASGALAVTLHALPNFIFYALPLSILMGGCLAVIRPAPAAPAAIPTLPSRLPDWLLPAVAGLTGVVLLLFIGLPAAFVRIQSGDCNLRMCGDLKRDPATMTRFARMLTAVQPSWLTGRDYLVSTYARAAETAGNQAERRRNAGEAIYESSTLLARYPQAYPQYQVLAGLLQKYPDQQDWLAEGVPTTPEALYRTALRHDPTLAISRVGLAAILRGRGQHREAYDVLMEGLGWRDVGMVSDGSRLAMLEAAIPAAVSVGECREAREMADGLLAYTPEHAGALAIKRGLGDALEAIINTPGCGLPAEATP